MFIMRIRLGKRNSIAYDDDMPLQGVPDSASVLVDRDRIHLPGDRFTKVYAYCPPGVRSGNTLHKPEIEKLFAGRDKADTLYAVIDWQRLTELVDIADRVQIERMPDSLSGNKFRYKFSSEIGWSLREHETIPGGRYGHPPNGPIVLETWDRLPVKDKASWSFEFDERRYSIPC